MTGKLNMSKRRRKAQERKAIEAIERATTDQELHEAIMMLPDPPPGKYDEHGELIEKPGSHEI